MDGIDALLLKHCCAVVVSDHNAAFRLQLDLWLRDHPFFEGAKFYELPSSAQSEILQKAAVSLRGPTN